MKKTALATLIIVVVIIASVSAVALYTLNNPQQPTETPTTKTIVDSTGTEVTVPTNITRVVALRSGIVEMLCVLGQEDKIVGVDEQTTAGTGYGTFNVQLCPELLGVTAPVSGKTINKEALIALQPDVVFIGGYGRLDWIEDLQDTGLTVVVTHFEEIGNYTRDLGIIAEVMGVEEEAQPFINHVQTTLDLIDDVLAI
jgi:iron complex transport system substrate-binding protein